MEEATRRIMLAKELLLELKATVSHIKNISTDISDSTGGVLGKVYEDHLDKIQGKVNQFNDHIDRIKTIHQEITKVVNEWYDFIQNDKELGRITFPLKLHNKRKTIQKTIRCYKNEISSMMIRNRLIREEMIRLESDLEFEATQRLKKDVRYDDYMTHLKRKSEILEVLQYLLQNLEGCSIKEIDVDHLDDCLQKMPS